MSSSPGCSSMPSIDINDLKRRIRARASPAVLPITAWLIIDADDWLIEQPCPGDQEIVVVTGETLDEPQIGREHLLLVVERAQRFGTQTFSVPGMEVFVTDQAEPTLSSIFVSPGPASSEHQGAIVMLQSSAAFRDDIEVSIV